MLKNKKDYKREEYIMYISYQSRFPASFPSLILLNQNNYSQGKAAC